MRRAAARIVARVTGISAKLARYVRKSPKKEAAPGNRGPPTYLLPTQTYHLYDKIGLLAAIAATFATATFATLATTAAAATLAHAITHGFAGLAPFGVAQFTVTIGVETLHGLLVVLDALTHCGAFGFIEFAITIGIKFRHRIGSATLATTSALSALSATSSLTAFTTTTGFAPHGFHVFANGFAFGLIELTVTVSIKLFHHRCTIWAGRFLFIGR